MVSKKKLRGRKLGRLIDHAGPPRREAEPAPGAAVQSAKQAVAVVTAYEKSQLRLVAELYRDPNLAELGAQLERYLRDPQVTLADRDAVVEAIGPQGPALINTMMVMLLAARGVRIWQQHRIVYRVHPELAVHLHDTSPGTAIPCTVFRRLAHPDPFLVFPAPLPAPHGRRDDTATEPPMYVGMLVTGATRELQPCSTADPNVHVLNIALIGRIRIPGSTEPHYQDYSVQIPCVSGSFTVEEMAGAALFATSDPDAAHNGARREAVRLAVGLLLYLCSDHRDIKESPRPASGPTKRRDRQRVLDRVLDVGFDIGPRLHTSRHTPPGEELPGRPGSTAPVRSHLRRAHWHTYWTGPRDQPVAEVRWIHPVLVNAADRDTTRPTVIDTAPTDPGR